MKVEDTRRWDLLRDFTSSQVDVTWKVLCRNKKSFALNYSTSEKGRDIFLKLVREADVLIENFKPGGLEKIGLGPEYLLEVNSALVIVRHAPLCAAIWRTYGRGVGELGILDR